MGKGLPNIDPEFIVICQSVWMNERGYGFDYDWDGERFNNRADAIKHGWELRGSDDFNIGQTYGDDLIWFGWMDKRIDEPEDTMREIAESCGLTFDPRWYRLEYCKATGRVIGRRAVPAAMGASEPGTCPDCQGSGYSNHPDSGQICARCDGQGG